MTRKRTPSSKTDKAAAGAKPEAVPFQKLSRFVFLRRELRGESELTPEVARNFEDELGELVDAEFVEITEENEVQYGKLDFDFGALLEQRLRDGGLSEPNAALLARVTLQHFQGAADLDDPQQANLAVDLAFALLRGVDTLSAAFNAAAEPPLAKWVDRDPKQFPTAESFLRYHFGPRLGMEGDLTLAEIGRYDTPLLTALNREFKGRRHELHVLLPTVTDRANQRLLERYGYVPQGSDRKSKLAMMSLQRKPNP